MSEREIKQIVFEASLAQKRRYDNYADEQGFKTRSEFIRTTLQKEMAGDMDSDSGSSENLTGQFADLTQTIQQLDRRIKGMDNEIRELKREVRDDPDLQALASDVFGILPTKKEIIRAAKTSGQSIHPGKSGLLEDIANELDESEHRVKDAIDRLQEDTHQVQTLILADEGDAEAMLDDSNNETRYYKRV